MELSYFPFYPKDFVADSKVQEMNHEEIGVYVLLLCYAWQNDPPGTIPTDDSKLARIARLSPERWAACKTAVLACFDGTDGGKLYSQKRLRQEYDRAYSVWKAKSAGGRKGGKANARNLKDSNKDSFKDSVKSATSKKGASGSGSCSSAQEEDEGLGEGEGNPTPSQKAAAVLAERFCFDQHPRHNLDSVYDIGEAIESMVEFGYPLEMIGRALHAKRDRSERWWQFKARLEKEFAARSRNGPPEEDPEERARRNAEHWRLVREEEARQPIVSIRDELAKRKAARTG